jgi:uncharacterized protein with PIN domain
MKTAYFRFYSGLNDFLLAEQRMGNFPYPFMGNPSVKSLVEGLGVPHTEVDLILVNGHAVGFSHSVHDGDCISVYPAFQSLDVSSVSQVRPPRLPLVRFVLDVHLGRLAAYLRMLGFDALYLRDWDDEELSRIAATDPRILLTRDAGLLMRRAVQYGYYVRESNARRQLGEVLCRFGLLESIQPFERCLRCNERLRPVPKDSVLKRLPLRTREHYNEFWQCEGCGRVYWSGSHYRRMKQFIGQVVRGLTRPSSAVPSSYRVGEGLPE